MTIEESRLAELNYFLFTEIEMAQERKTKQSSIYEGIEVGNELCKKLTDNHIQFCQRILKIIT